MPGHRVKRARLVALGLPVLVAACATTVTVPLDGDAQRDLRTRVGCPDEVKDGEGHAYPTVVVGEQCWLGENLRATRFRDGSVVADVSEIDVARYGLLYRFTDVADARGLCPSGWHVPSDDEVQALERAVGVEEDALQERGWRGARAPARALKESAEAYGFTDDEARDVNRSGLSIRAAGEHIGAFKGADGLYAGLWTSTAAPDGTAWVRYFTWLALNPRQEKIWRDTVDPARKYSVRCVQDPAPTGG